MQRLVSTLIVAGLVASTAPAIATPPRVVSVQPPNGETAVDPATAEIRIEFDQEMDRTGYSVCGGGQEFPKLAGPGRWASARVFTLSVQLEPEHEYRFSINCPTGQRFRNSAGEPVENTPVRFRTGKAGPPKSQTERNRAAIAALRVAIEERYSHRDRVVKDWLALFARAEHGPLEAKTPVEFAERAGAMLRAAQDGHLSLKVGEKIIPTIQLDLRANGDPLRLPKVVPQWKQETRGIASGRFEDSIGYLLIASWQGEAATFQAAHEALSSFDQAKGAVLDLRFNAGGDERIAQQFAARFVRERARFAQHRFRDPLAPSGWTPLHQRFIDPVAEPSHRYAAKVAVLIGRRCFSSNESFLLMMKYGAKAALVGVRSYGSSGNPQPIDLRNGVTLLLPS